MGSDSFSRSVLNIGFVVALALAATAFVMAGWYLTDFAGSTHQIVRDTLATAHASKPITGANLELLQDGLVIQTYLARVLLLSCGFFIALSFGFLGFALFLVGASGQSDLAAGSGAGLKLSLSNLAPGSIAIVAATILAGLCATRTLPINLNFGATPPAAAAAPADGTAK